MNNKKVEIFLDSGAYSAFTQNKPVDIDSYIQYIKDHPEITTYCCLDVISDEIKEGTKVTRPGEPSYRNYMYMREKGLNPLPVFHAGVDYKYLDMYLEMTDYIAIGAVSGNQVGQRHDFMKQIWATKLIDNKGYPIAKFHGFGITSLDTMITFPWYSVDSTSWVLFSKFGVVLIPQYNEIQRRYDYRVNPYKVVVSDRSPHIDPNREILSTKKEWKHIKDFNKHEKEYFSKYINDNGFLLGKSNVDWSGDKPKVEVIEAGVSNTGKYRDQLNYLYYLQLEQNTPKYPWAYTPKTKHIR